MDTEPLNLECDNCGSIFQLIFMEDEVSNTPDYCPFCADQLNLKEIEENYDEDEDENSHWD